MDMVLNNSSNRQSFSESGFPFDDDRNRINIRTYLDEIASRHPEFADQLKEPPWGEEFVDPAFQRAGKGPGSGKEEGTLGEASGSNQGPSQPKEKEPRQNLSNFGLRNTVPLGPGAVHEQERGQRSMSAPPENRAADKTRRFVTKCEIPVMNDPMQDPTQIKSDPAAKAAQEQAQQKGNSAPNVRVIPIQVEGRDTPLVNTNVDTSTNFGSEPYRDAGFEGRLPRDFGSYQKHSPRFSHKERAPTPPQYQYAPHYQQYGPPHQHFPPPHQQNYMPQQQFAPHQQQYAPHQQQYAPHQQQFAPHNQQYAPHPQHFAPHHQQAFPHQEPHSQRPPAPPPPHQQHPQHPQQPQQQQQHQQPPPPPQQQQGPKPPQETETPKPHPHPPKPEIKDPIEKVQVIQKEVDELMKQVESFNGNSRTDKQYLMLDELLTRQLLLLDNIDTEGKENVRQARKDTIRSIQRCISTLENKVPLPENNESTGESKDGQEGEAKSEESGASQAMEVDQTKENTPVETNESQKMEVDDKVAKEPQQQEQQQQQQPKEEGKEKA